MATRGWVIRLVMELAGVGDPTGGERDSRRSGAPAALHHDDLPQPERVTEPGRERTPANRGPFAYQVRQSKTNLNRAYLYHRFGSCPWPDDVGQRDAAS